MYCSYTYKVGSLSLVLTVNFKSFNKSLTCPILLFRYPGSISFLILLIFIFNNLHTVYALKWKTKNKIIYVMHVVSNESYFDDLDFTCIVFFIKQ